MSHDNETSIDLLGFDYLVDSLEVVLTEPRLLPVTVGVLGGDSGYVKWSLTTRRGCRSQREGRGRSLARAALAAGGRVLIAGLPTAFPSARQMGVSRGHWWQPTGQPPPGKLPGEGLWPRAPPVGLEPTLTVRTPDAPVIVRGADPAPQTGRSTG